MAEVEPQNDEPRLLTDLERLNAVICQLFHDLGCNCPICADRGDNDALFNLTYLVPPEQGFNNADVNENEDNNMREEQRVFDFSQGYMQRLFREPQPSFMVIKSQYERYFMRAANSSNLRGGSHPLYRKMPMDWTALFSLPKIPRKDTNTVYYEHNDATLIRPGVLCETRRYNKRLKSHIKYAMLVSHLRLQTRMTGFFKPPLQGSPFIPWFQRGNWAWIDSETTTLVDWSNNLNYETGRHWEMTLREIRQAANKYWSDCQLSDTDLWISQIRKPAEYIQHLLNNHQIINKLFCIALNIGQKLQEELRISQSEFSHLLERIIQRYDQNIMIT